MSHIYTVLKYTPMDARTGILDMTSSDISPCQLPDQLSSPEFGER